MLRNRSLLVVVVVTLLLSLALAACGGEGATATSPAAQALLDASKDQKAATAAAAESTAATVLTVGDVAFTMDELKALDQGAANTADGGYFSGVKLMAVLDAAGVTADTISLVASDGYSSDVAVSDIDDAAVLAFDADGTLDAVIPTLDKGSWVKDVASIAVK